ncbi:hypothetical protein ACFL13_03150 [Patescibacteria group bacterium]
MKNQSGLILIPMLLIIVGAGGYLIHKSRQGQKIPNEIEKVLGTVEGVSAFRKFLNKSNDLENNSNCPKPNTWAMVITESKANELLQNNVGKYKYGGYSVEGGEINFLDGGLEANLKLNKNRELYIRLSLIKDGADFNVEEVKSVGGKSVSNLELILLKTGLKNLDKIIKKLAPEEYVKSFHHIDIYGDYKMDVFFYTSEYLDCIKG